MDCRGPDVTGPNGMFRGPGSGASVAGVGLDGRATRAPATSAASTADGAADTPGVRREEADAADVLRARLRVELSSRLAGRAASRAGGQTDSSGGLGRAGAEAVLVEAAEAHTRDVLGTGGVVVEPELERRVIVEVLDEMFGFAGLQPLLDDPQVENINVNGADRVFVRYADGQRDRLAQVASSDAELVELIRDLAARSGVEERRFDRGAPGVSFALPDGSRAFAVMAVTSRPSLSIRRHRYQRVSLAELRRAGTIDGILEAFLTAAVRARKNILITGGTSIGKTTLLRALAAAIPSWERLVTVEDVFEPPAPPSRCVHLGHQVRPGGRGRTRRRRPRPARTSPVRGRSPRPPGRGPGSPVGCRPVPACSAGRRQLRSR